MTGIPTAEELEVLFREGKMERLGDGSRRVCYALPGGKLCVKSYRAEDELETRMRPDGSLEKHMLKPSVVREIRNARFDEKRNTSCQEYQYWKKLRDKLPLEIFEVFPQTMECILVPSRGWCLIEDLLKNADGAPIKKFAYVYKSAERSLRDRLLASVRGLMHGLLPQSVRFYDPQNIMVQFVADGKFCLRIVDFEPVSRTWIRLDRLLPCMARMKMRRRFERFEKMLKDI